MEIRKINFRPMYSAMQLTSKDVEVAMNNTLNELSGYRGSKVKLAGNQLKIQIAFDCSTCCITKSKVAAIIKSDASFKVSQELKDALVDKFIHRSNIDNIQVLEVKNIYVVELDATLTLLTLMPEDNEAEYNLAGAVLAGDVILMTIMKLDKSMASQMRQQQHKGPSKKGGNNCFPQNNNSGNRRNNYHNNKGNNRNYKKY